MADPKAYPLEWPMGWKRTLASDRRNGKFMTTLGRSIDRVQEQLRLMGVDRRQWIVSTDLRPRLDGLPRADQGAPTDAGVALYFRTDVEQPWRCIAIDTYSTVNHNMAAIAATLEAIRAIERHGSAEVMNRAMSGLAALPATTAGPSWWDVLQVNALASADEIQQAFRRLAKVAHADSPTGSHDAMTALNIARDQGLSAATGRGE